MNRRQVLTGASLAVGAAGFMLALGCCRSGGQPATGRGLLPLPIKDMSFSLTDHNGRPFGPSQWLGRPTMVFFGFIFCPDVCPTTLSDISDWLTDFGPEADRLNVALISVDPERDTPAVLAEYLANFDPRIVGLTASCPSLKRPSPTFARDSRNYRKTATTR